jgi:hypothetical protein
MIKILKNYGLPELGKIKIGKKGEEKTSARGNTFRMPVKLDHFVITKTVRDDRGDYVVDEQLMKKIEPNTGKPKELDIYLPFNDINLNFPHGLAWYSGKTRFCVGDGKKAYRLAIKGRGKDGREIFGERKEHSPCGESCNDYMAKRCKPHGILICLIKGQEQVGGGYIFRTTSWNSIKNIVSSLRAIQITTGGWLSWIPLKMKLVPHTTTTSDGNTVVVYVVQIYYQGSPEKLLSDVKEVLQVRAPLLTNIKKLEHEIKMLPAGLPEDTEEEAEDVEEEYYSGNGETVHADSNESGQKQTEDKEIPKESVKEPEPMAATEIVGDAVIDESKRTELLMAASNKKGINALRGFIKKEFNKSEVKTLTVSEYKKVMVYLESEEKGDEKSSSLQKQKSQPTLKKDPEPSLTEQQPHEQVKEKVAELSYSNLW